MNRRDFLLSSAAAFSAQRLGAIELSRIRLGVTTDEIDEDVLTAAKFLQEFKLGWAEVRNVWGKYNTVQPLDKIREAKALLDQHGVKVSVLGTAFFKIPLPEGSGANAILDNQWALLDSAMERAKIFGTDKLRVFAFTYRNGETLDKSKYPRIYELVAAAAKRAKARGFRLALENVGESYVWSGAEAGELLKHVKDENLGLTWDPNNAGTSGEKSFPDGYKHLDPKRIFHVHLRDYRKGANGRYEWCAVGEGEMDNLGQIRTLLRAGYQESFTLETHYKHPQGKAMASRVSLGGLLKVFERV
jgi:sugar phosphate isomerase/epimerase